jgi:hypothetical protein
MDDELNDILNFKVIYEEIQEEKQEKIIKGIIKKNLCVFLTHNFNPIFLNKIKEFDKIKNDKIDIIILFDKKSNNQNNMINDIRKQLHNIKIIDSSILKNCSYDIYGHTMYIKYFKENIHYMDNYEYFWFIENDTFINFPLDIFVNNYNDYSNEFLSPEIGLRSKSWKWFHTLKGFTNKYNVGCLCCIIRLKQNILKDLINDIDSKYRGYLEILLTNLVYEKNYSMVCFKPEDIGIVNVYGGPLINLIRGDIENNSNKFIERKIYHPIK